MDSSAILSKCSGAEFALAAGLDGRLWVSLSGVSIEHVERGPGKVQRVEERANYVPLLHMDFNGVAALFNGDSLKNGKTTLHIPNSIRLLVERALAELQRLAAIEAEARRKQLEEEIEDQRVAMLRAAEREYEMKVRHAEQVEIDRQMKEAWSKEQSRLEPLMEKFAVRLDELIDRRGLSPLVSILEGLERNDLPDDNALSWLEQNKSFRLLAWSYYLLAKNKGDKWMGVKACKFWRLADLPQKAIDYSEKLLLSVGNDTRLRSALLTTRGAALRDVGNLEMSKECALGAVEVSPNSFHPFNLLGGISYDEGEPAVGDNYFAEAVRLGATPMNQEFEIRRSVERAEGETRARIIEHLLRKDSTKYAWARRLSID